MRKRRQEGCSAPTATRGFPLSRARRRAGAVTSRTTFFHEAIDVHSTALTERRHPAIKLRAADQDLPAYAVARQRMRHIRQVSPEVFELPRCCCHRDLPDREHNGPTVRVSKDQPALIE